MAQPNASFSELLSLTVQELEDELFDNVLLKNALSATIGRATRDGGPSIVIPIEFAENGSYKRYSGAEILNTTINDVFSSYQYPWFQVALNIQISGREMLINSGRSQNRELLKSRVMNAKHTFENQFNIDMLSTGGLTNQIVGLQTLIADDPTSGSVGGISRVSYSFARNQFYRATTDGGAAATAANLPGYMDALDLRIQAWRGKTKTILADDNFFRLFEGSVHPLQRLSPTEGQLARLGFRTYAYKQAEVVFEPQAAGMPSNHMYFIDPDVIELISHTDRNLVQLPKRDSYNQDQSISYLGWMGALCVKNFLRLGVLNNN